MTKAPREHSTRIAQNIRDMWKPAVWHKPTRRQVLGCALGTGALGASMLIKPGFTDNSNSPIPTYRSADARLKVQLPPHTGVIPLGIIYTLGSGNEGNEWFAAAAGARIAQYRLHLAGAHVELYTVNDKGTRAGAQQAAQQLIDAGVQAVIIATAGEHIQGSLEVLTDLSPERRIPILELYDYVPVPVKEDSSLQMLPTNQNPDRQVIEQEQAPSKGIWSLAPAPSTIAEHIAKLVPNAQAIILIEDNQVKTPGLIPAMRFDYRTASDPDSIPQKVRDAEQSLGSDSAVVDRKSVV